MKYFQRASSILIIFFMGQCLALDSDILQSLIGSSPQVNPQISTSSKTNVSPCRGSGITFYQNLTQAIFNSYLINPNIGEKPIKVCDTLGVIQNFLPLAKTEKYNDSCDYSYIVFIEGTVNGSRSIVCQGIHTGLCTIVTVYDCLQTGTDLQVRFQNGAKYPVVCVQSSQEKNIGIGPIYLIELIIKADCCIGLSKLPDIQSTNGELVVIGNLITRDNCSSTDSKTRKVEAILIPANGIGGLYAAVPFSAKQICNPYAGMPFIGQDGKLYGIAFYRPALILYLLFGLPVTTAIDTSCFLTLVSLK